MNKTLAVVIPCYNEAKTIGVVLKKLKSLDFVDQIILVDDNSTDN